MKDMIIIKGWEWLPKSNNRVIYEDEKGRRFVGHVLDHVDGDTLFIEYSEESKYGFPEILKIIFRIPAENKSAKKSTPPK